MTPIETNASPRLDHDVVNTQPGFSNELLSNLVFEGCWLCGDLVLFGGFNSVFERDAVDDFGEGIKAA